MVDIRNAVPPVDGLLPARFRCIDMVQDRTFILWDTGDSIKRKSAPVVWATFEYWDETSREAAGKRLRFITGVLNGNRPAYDLLDID